jgi:hypothetical protein
MAGKIPIAILDMLNEADTDAAVFPPTDLYNEGWMLRLVLFAGAKGIPCLPFSFLPRSRWFSEALLYSPFLARSRNDKLAETHTHADGVIGHFKFAPTTKTGLELLADSKQFIVIEAKMFSSLREGTTRASFYDQAARSVACMATTLDRGKSSVDNLESIGFYVIAPDSQIRQGLFANEMTRESIVKKVRRRIEQYQEDREYHARLESWFQKTFDPLIQRIDLRCWPWENAVNAIDATEPAGKHPAEEFYRRCLRHNQKTTQ